MSIEDFIDLAITAKPSTVRPPPPPAIIGETIAAHPLGYSLRYLHLPGTEEHHDLMLEVTAPKLGLGGLGFPMSLFDYPAPYRTHVVLWWPDGTADEIRAEVERIADAIKVSAALSWLASQCRPWHRVMITHEGRVPSAEDAPAGR